MSEPSVAVIEELTEAMRDVVDPELGINVVDLGLVYGITLDQNRTAVIDMTLTSAACPLTDVIEDQTRSALAKRLLQQAADTKNAGAERYALLHAAETLAVENGELSLTFTVIDRMAESFEIDVPAHKAEALAGLAKAAKMSEVHKLLLDAGVEVHVFDGSEVAVKGDGGPTCLTQPLWRA